MQTPSAPLRREVNFGGNQSWHTRRHRPASEAEVLDLLDRRQGDRIRAVGSKHSWSPYRSLRLCGPRDDLRIKRFLSCGESRLADAVEMLRSVTELFAGSAKAVLTRIEQRLRAIGLYDELLAQRGQYVQHYPFFFRRVLPEETLVSMAASMTEPSYSISIFTYDRPGRRNQYYKFCSFLARALNRLVAARLHWGKHFPLEDVDIAPLYPEMGRFHALCQRNDSAGVFRNRFTARVLGLAPGRP